MFRDGHNSCAFTLAMILQLEAELFDHFDISTDRPRDTEYGKYAVAP